MAPIGVKDGPGVSFLIRAPEDQETKTMRKAEEKMAGYSVFTMEDIYEDRPPRTYAVHGVNEMPSVNILYGTPTAMKSMLLADKVHCILNGIPWLRGDGIPGVRTTKTGVLWVDMDNGRRRTKDRLAAIGRHYGTPKDAPLYVVSCPSEGLSMKEPEHVLRLQDTISFDVGYVVVDNLGYVSGGADENTTAMVPVMGAFRALSERTGVAFEIIHHERKGSALGNERAGDKIRGSSSIEGALDRAFRVVRKEDDDFVTVFSIKERDQRIRPMSARFHFRWDTRPGYEEELGEAWFTGESADTIEFQVQRAILSFVSVERHNQTEIIEKMKEDFEDEKVGKPTILKALKWLEDDGKVVKEPGAKGAILYRSSDGLSKFTDIVGYNHEIVPTEVGVG